jgi:hypothetical protein
VKNTPCEEPFGRRICPAENLPVAGLSGRRMLRRRIDRPIEKISVALWRRIFLAKNHPTKKFPPPEIFFERRIIRRRILLAKNTPSEEYSLRRTFLAKNSPAKNFPPYQKITVAKNFPAKNHPSEELSGEEFS